MAGGADAGRVAERELVGAEVEQPLADRDDLVDRDRALPRVAEAHRDVRADVDPLRQRPRHGRLEHRELLVERAVEVAPGEGLGGAAEDRDVPDALRPAPGRGRARSGTSTGIGVARRCGRPGRGAPRRRRAAGTHFGWTKLVDLDDRQPGGDQPLDELDLDLERDDR